MRHKKLKAIIFILIGVFVFNGLSVNVLAVDLSNPPSGNEKLFDLEKVIPKPIVEFFGKLEQLGVDFIASIKADDAIENPEEGADGIVEHLINAWNWIKDKLEDVLGVDFINKVGLVANWIVEKFIYLIKSII